MHLETYLTFDGNCREVFEFYREVFGGEFSIISTFGEGPPGMGIADDEQDRIMHVSLPIGASVLMGSDTSRAFGPAPEAGTNFSLSVAPDSREQCDELFAKLSAGGNATTPMQDMFWGDYFGQVTDKFGIQWMINYDTAPQQG